MARETKRGNTGEGDGEMDGEEAGGNEMKKTNRLKETMDRLGTEAR